MGPADGSPVVVRRRPALPVEDGAGFAAEGWADQELRRDTSSWRFLLDVHVPRGANIASYQNLIYVLAPACKCFNMLIPLKPSKAINWWWRTGEGLCFF